jgi:hypothetical protein
MGNITRKNKRGGAALIARGLVRGMKPFAIDALKARGRSVTQFNRMFKGVTGAHPELPERSKKTYKNLNNTKQALFSAHQSHQNLLNTNNGIDISDAAINSVIKDKWTATRNYGEAYRNSYRKNLKKNISSSPIARRTDKPIKRENAKFVDEAYPAELIRTRGVHTLMYSEPYSIDHRIQSIEATLALKGEIITEEQREAVYRFLMQYNNLAVIPQIENTYKDKIVQAAADSPDLYSAISNAKRAFYRIAPEYRNKLIDNLKNDVIMREKLEQEFQTMTVAETSFGMKFSEIIHKVTVAFKEITAEKPVSKPAHKQEMQ